MTPEEKNDILDIIQDSICDIFNEDILFMGGGGNSSYLKDVFNDIECRHPEISWIKNGVSKIVIAFNDIKDYVIKIPFKGCLGYDDEEEYFCNADCGDNFINENEWDYCETEARCFEEAKYYNVEKMFAKTEFFGSFMDEPIYISEKVINTLEYNRTSYSPTTTEIVKSLSSEHEDLDWSFVKGDGLSSFVECYGEKDARNLVEFLEEYCISDLHEANIGYDKNGNVKIIDYSNWND